VSFIDRHLDEGRGAKVAIRTVREDVTYAELAKAVARAGNALRGLGLAKGERVLMIIKDCPAFYYVFWGAIKAGLVPVPLNTLLRQADYRFMLEDSGCAALIYSPEYAAEVEPALAAAKPGPRHALLTEGKDGAFDTMMARAADSLAPAPAKPTDDCFWLYSSGSTGRPKGAVHLQRDMVVSSQYYGVETLGVTEADICFSAAKLFFAYGLGNGMTFPLWVGATAVLSDQRPSPDMTFDIIKKFRPTLYFGVPTLYAAQLAALASAKPDLSSIRYCVSAGEALPAEIFRKWKEQTGLTILDGIGSTEALHIFISNNPKEATPGTSGRIVTGYDAKIVDPDGKAVSRGEPGRLIIKGLSCAKYYWNNPERTASTMKGEWLDTGDTYEQDPEGRYVYCGRSDDMLKVGGIWCSPFEIEAKLIEHPKVLEAAIVGRKDDADLVKPEAHIVLKNPADASDALKDDILRHIKAGLAPYKYPRWIHFVTELPKTATGKIQRFKLRQAT
ncbi:MAG: benzoate-CoA ligase family protein, partial [Alphaproteobacteria bacterium]|nr:benzoate-CoA ligase family protein [Alphaproteobacteria bacterium]